jgi:RHS repeat-associated protein
VASASAANAPAPYTSNYGCWNYDVFGNRTSESMSTTQCGNSPPLLSWAKYNSANNQVYSASTRTAGFAYDQAGNILYDGVNDYWYDAEGRLCAMENLTLTSVTAYLYDAEGRRVAKGSLSAVPPGGSPTGNVATTGSCGPNTASTSGFTLESQYLLDSGGNQATELTGAVGLQTWLHSNVWSSGKILATYDSSGIHFPLTDPLGTKRIQAKATGAVDLTCITLPFGDGPGCNGDNATEHRFTGKERDTESGNDYFGARYYASAMGRWLSPDWAAKAMPVPYAKLDNPQSLNLYSYVFNNPLSHLDDDGHEVITVQLRAYIPQASVGPYRGDNRGPTASQTVNSRTAITLTIETNPAISANPLLYNSGGIAGTTHNDLTGNSATQTVGLPAAQVSRDANGNVVINIQQNAANPLTPAAVTPGIQSNVTVGVPVNGSSVTTSGTVSGAPAFELNVQTPGNPTTNIPLQSNPPTNPIAFGAALTQTNQLPTTTTPLPAPCQGSNCHQ